MDSREKGALGVRWEDKSNVVPLEFIDIGRPQGANEGLLVQNVNDPIRSFLVPRCSHAVSAPPRDYRTALWLR